MLFLSFPFRCILGGLSVFRDITSVFFTLMFKAILLAFICKLDVFFSAFVLPDDIVKPGHLHNLSPLAF
jgi:hypothetical protein